MRWALAVGLAGALSVGAPVGAGEIAGYPALVAGESTRTLNPAMTRSLASTDARLAARAALALGRTKNRLGGAFLAKSARKASDPAVRAMSVFAYGLLADRMGLDPAVVGAALRDRAGVVRAAAADAAWRALAAPERQGPGTAERMRTALLQALRDADPGVRGRAALGLSAAGGDATAAALLAAYDRESDGAVRLREAWTLRRTYAKAVPVAAIRRGLGDPDETIRIQWVAAAGGHGDPALASDLEPLVHQPSWRVAEQAIEAIKKLSGADPTIHLTAVPDGVVTPGPVPDETTSPLPRPATVPPLRRPAAAAARLDLPLLPESAAALERPMPGPHPRVRLTTTQGPVVVRLYPEWAPITVAAFEHLVDAGKLDGRRWFRIVPDFVVQTGDITAKNDGNGDSPYTLPAEENPLQQRAGIIAMGMEYGKDKRAIRDSAGTEFYLTISPQFHLDLAFSVFGEIESGFDVLGRLLENDTIVRADRLADD